MTRIIALALAIAAGTVATASEDRGGVDAATQDAIRAQLTAEGYEVRRIKTEDGLYEAYALKDGQRYEIYLDRALKVVRTGMDD